MSKKHTSDTKFANFYFMPAPLGLDVYLTGQRVTTTFSIDENQAPRTTLTNTTINKADGPVTQGEG